MYISDNGTYAAYEIRHRSMCWRDTLWIALGTFLQPVLIIVSKLTGCPIRLGIRRLPTKVTNVYGIDAKKKAP